MGKDNPTHQQLGKEITKYPIQLKTYPNYIIYIIPLKLISTHFFFLEKEKLNLESPPLPFFFLLHLLAA